MFRYPVMSVITDANLSPIQEETEEMMLNMTPDVINDNQINSPTAGHEQRNNNTPLEPDAADSNLDEQYSQIRQVRRSTSPDKMAANVLQDVTVSRPSRDFVQVMEPVRKTEMEVEVLKQKYINNDILDMPCSGFVQGPIRYGRLHRSRSLHLNLASQDIRTQMNKLRAKVGNGGGNLRMQFRCTKVATSNNANAKTLEELVNGDTDCDDYDPELARLFDDYVDECDQVTRGDCTVNTGMVRQVGANAKGTGVIETTNTDTKEAFWRGFMEGMNHSKHQEPSETEALSHVLTIHEGGGAKEVLQDPCIDKTSHADMIRNNQDITHKFLKEWERNYSNTTLTEDGKCVARDSNSDCFACKTEQAMLGDILSNPEDTLQRPKSSDGKKDKTDHKAFVQRNVLRLGQTSINLKIENDSPSTNTGDIKTSPKDKTEHKQEPKRYVLRSTPRKRVEDDRHNPQESKDPKVPVLRVTNAVLPPPSTLQRPYKPEDGTTTSSCIKTIGTIGADKPNDDINMEFSNTTKDDGTTPSRTPAKHVTERRPKHKSDQKVDETTSLTPGPFMKLKVDSFTGLHRGSSRSGRASRDINLNDVKECVHDEKISENDEQAIEKLSRIKAALDDAVYKEYQFRDENISIITLAKMKLENKFMSSLGFEEMVRSRHLKDIGAREDKSTARSRSEEPAVEKERAMIKSILRNLDLDGWEATTKPFCEQDTLHMSSSELLHPVDSTDSFSSHMVGRSSNATPLLNSLDKKFLMLKSTEQTPVGSRTITPDRGTPTSAKLSDLENGNGPRRTFETNAFKPNNRKAKQSERVMLRLTKSCDSFVTKAGQYKDPAFANIPLARCLSYNIERKMKTDVAQTSNINLSDSLAKQLKELGKDKDKAKSTTPRGQPSNIPYYPKTGDKLDNEVNGTVSFDLPLLDGKKLTTQKSQLEFSQVPTMSGVILPDIEIGNYQQDMASKQRPSRASDDRTNKARTLPPISGTRLLTPDNNQPIRKPSSDGPQPGRMLHQDDEAELWMTRSLPCRTESLQTPYTFDKADPSKLLLRARGLPHLHSVCTSCGGINEQYENTSGHERIPSRASAANGKTKSVHHRCHTPANDEKWKLEKPHIDIFNELPKLGISQVPSENKPDPAPSQTSVKKTLSSNDYSKYERTRKPAGKDEMTFKFLDQNIKLRFDIDMPKEEKVKIMESLQCATGSEGPTSRLLDMAKASHRDKLECAITRETRIYREKNRQKYLLQSGEASKKNSPASSPYVEYCKRKAHLQSIKGTDQNEKYIDMNEDVRVTREQITSKQALKKHFPVIHAKSNKNSSKKKMKSSTSKQEKSSLVKSAIPRQQKNNFCVEPGKLPTISAQSPRREEKKASKRQMSSENNKVKQNSSTSSESSVKLPLPNISGRRSVNIDLSAVSPFREN